MKRKRLSDRVRASLFINHNGVCHICGGKIVAGEVWEVSHVRPLELGGEDELTNMAPAHYRCHRDQTAQEDVPRIRKAQRQQRAHIGAKTSKNPLPGGRGSPWKKKLDGSVVRRKR